MQTMKAVVLTEVGSIEHQELPIPKPAEGELLVQVRAATTCGTDLKIFRRGHPKFPPPFVFGHEFGGDVVECGPGVTKFRPGMPVTANVFGECGHCFYCQRGQGNLCENLEYNFGAFAQFHIIPASIVRENTFEIPPHLTYAEAAIVEPFVCVVHALKLLHVQPGERVVVIGAGGPISLLFIQMLKLAGAEEIVAIGHSDYRLSIAKQLGATRIVHARENSPQEMDNLVKDWTDGHGMDAVIECAGKLETWVSAIEMSRRGGRVLWFGGLPGGTSVPVDAARVHYGEVLLINSHGGTARDAQKAFNLISSGAVETRSLISKEMPLNQTRDALDLMISGEAIKVALIP